MGLLDRGVGGGGGRHVLLVGDHVRGDTVVGQFSHGHYSWILKHVLLLLAAGQENILL